MMDWLQLATLPQVSEARHVRRATSTPGQRGLATLVMVSETTIAPLVPSQTSTAVGGVKSHGEPHSTDRLGAQVRLGGCVSTTVIIWLQSDELVQPSVARQVRVTLSKLGQRGLA